MPKRVLILGGGTGGLIAAKTLAHSLKAEGAEAEITLITNNPWHEFQPLFFDVALSTAKPEETRARASRGLVLGCWWRRSRL